MYIQPSALWRSVLSGIALVMLAFVFLTVLRRVEGFDNEYDDWCERFEADRLRLLGDVDQLPNKCINLTASR